MIHYQLRCDKGHEFEGWFNSSSTFDAQVKRRLVSCSRCGSQDVEKAIMAPSVARTDRPRSRRKRVEEAATDGVPVAAAQAPPMPPTLINGEQRQLIEKMRELRAKVLASSEYVGPNFAAEARKIHSDEAPARSIHGEASPAEVEALHEEGVEVYPVPVLPEDKN